VLYAADIAHRNWLLRGWTLPEDPYWFTNVLLYAAGVAVHGMTPVLVYIVPVMVCLALLLVLAVAATIGLGVGPGTLFVAILPALPILFPSSTMVTTLLVGPFHRGTTVVTLVSMIMLYRAQAVRPPSGGRWLPTAGAFVLLTASEVSDPYTTVIAVIPVTIVSLAWLARDRSAGPAERRARLLPLAAVVAAWLGGHVAILLIRQLGGAAIIPFGRATIASAQFGRSVANLVVASLDLGGGNIFGQTINAFILPVALRLCYLAAASLFTVQTLRDAARALSRGGPREDWLTTVLATSVAVVFVGNILGTANYDASYRLPMCIVLGVVLARKVGPYISPPIWDRRALATAVGVLLLVFYAAPTGQFLRHTRVAADSTSHLGQWLMAHRLTDGYGDYSLSTVTLKTRGAVRIRSILSTKIAQPGLGPSRVPSARWRLCPYDWMSKNAWYQHPAKFVVLDPKPSSDPYLGLTKEVAVKTFGRPDHEYDNVDSFTVLVWDRPRHF
jgi:hypothetical protein